MGVVFYLETYLLKSLRFGAQQKIPFFLESDQLVASVSSYSQLMRSGVKRNAGWSFRFHETILGNLL